MTEQPLNIKRIEIRQDGLARVLDQETLPATLLYRLAKSEDMITVSNRLLAVRPLPGEAGLHLLDESIWSLGKSEPSIDSSHLRGKILNHLLELKDPTLPREIYFTSGRPKCVYCSTERNYSDYVFPIQFYIEKINGRLK
jgi:hypothetical protein